jgi:hypothetical protein
MNVRSPPNCMVYGRLDIADHTSNRGTLVRELAVFPICQDEQTY